MDAHGLCKYLGRQSGKSSLSFEDDLRLLATSFDFSLQQSCYKGKEFGLYAHQNARMCYFIQYLVFIKTEKKHILDSLFQQLCKKS